MFQGEGLFLLDQNSILLKLRSRSERQFVLAWILHELCRGMFLQELPLLLRLFYRSLRLKGSSIPSGFSFSKDRIRLTARSIDIQEDGTAKVSGYIRVSLLPEISVEEIRREISGKSIKEAQDYLRDRDHIMGVEIGIETPFPFGQNSLPGNLANISVTIASL